MTRQLSPRKPRRDYRIEIPKPVKLEVFRRAGGPEAVRCEGCGMLLGGKRFDYDHIHPEVFQTTPKGQRPPIVAEDVKLLGYDCCHKEKSAREHKANCHSKRIIDKAIGAKKSRNPLPGSRQSGWKKTFSNGWVRR